MKNNPFIKNDPIAVKLWEAQQSGTAKPEYPHGKITQDDEGELAIALATDHKNQLVIIRFPKPVDWVGLSPDDVRGLCKNLLRKVDELEAKDKP